MSLLDPAQTLAQPSLCIHGGGFFFSIVVSVDEIKVEINTTPALFSGQKNGEGGTKFTDHLLAHLGRGI